MPLRTVLFDLGNVLLYFSHARMCAQIADLFQVSEATLQHVIFGEQLQRRFERGEVSEQDFRQALQTAFGRTVDAKALRQAGSDIFTLNQPMVPLLDRLKRDGLRLVLLSNTCITHYEFVREHFDVLDRFDHCVLSYAVGAAKPEAAIFAEVLARIDCAPDECFYTDDIAEYVEQGRTFGLHAAVFSDVPTLEVELARLGVTSSNRP